MPKEARIAIRLALTWLLVGFAAGSAIAMTRVGLVPRSAFLSLFDVHVGAVLLGFFAQMVLGVAQWMFPKHGKGNQRGVATLYLSGILIFNVGVLLRTLGVFVTSLPFLATKLSVGVIALGLAACVSQIWPRVKPFQEVKVKRERPR